MTLTFVGTGSGKTSLNRFHSAVLFSTSSTKLLIDAGDGISKALLNLSIEYNSIDEILFTHLHADHYAGFASLITQMKLQKREKTLKVYSHHSLIEVLKKFLIKSYLFPERLGFEINFISVSENLPIKIDNELSLKFILNSHLSELSGFTKYSELSFCCGSVLLNFNSKKIFYSSDIGSAKDLLNPEILNADVLIIEVTHLSSRELIDTIIKIQAKRVFFSHISDEQEESIMQIKEDLNSISGIIGHVSSDGLVIKI